MKKTTRLGAIALTGLLSSPVIHSNASELVTVTPTGSLPTSLWSDNDRVRDVLQPTTDFSTAEKFELLQGGAGSSKKTADRNAYSQHTQTLDFEGLQNFKIGNALFNKLWVSSPSSTLASDGIGPFYNARACQSCHIKDGRGQRPMQSEKTASFLLQLKNKQGDQWNADPVYGAQLQTSAVPGIQAEALVRIDTTPIELELDDGTLETLHQPSYHLIDLAYGPLHEDTVISPRLAPSMPGLGLLQAIDERHILAYEDPDDANNDGISGRANWQLNSDGTRSMGRFGLKAAAASIRVQTAHAFVTDMGLSSSLFNHPNGDCTKAQSVCDNLADGVQQHLSDYEVSDEILELVSFYSENLAVPVRRTMNAENVLKGKSLFYEANCIACHTPKHVTSKEAAQPEHQFQLIWPYTDLLLHDMGEALADNAGEGEATGREWRTAPLWGIGLAQTINPRTSFLHDGRASTLLEATLWHGGEAEASANYVKAMSAIERDALVSFLESL